MTELRLHAREERLTALLALGRHERVAGEAEGFTVEHPRREQQGAADGDRPAPRRPPG